MCAHGWRKSEQNGKFRLFSLRPTCLIESLQNSKSTLLKVEFNSLSSFFVLSLSLFLSFFIANEFLLSSCTSASREYVDGEVERQRSGAILSQQKEKILKICLKVNKKRRARFSTLLLFFCLAVVPQLPYEFNVHVLQSRNFIIQHFCGIPSRSHSLLCR